MPEVTDTWPLAGRSSELTSITALIDRGGAGAVVLSGPAGVGKSRLAEESRALADARGRATARVMASHAAAAMPLGALAPILPAELDQSATPAELFARTLAALSPDRNTSPVVLLVDDAHVLDNSSAVLLTQLIGAGALLVIATVREGASMPDAVASWWRTEGAVRIDLADLGPAATGEVLSAALGGAVGRDTVKRLHLATGGNPLLLREVVVHAHHTGTLRDDSGTWQLLGAVPALRRLTDLLDARIVGLGAPERRVLDALAVCGPLGPDELPERDGFEPATVETLERAGLIRVLIDDHRVRLALTHPLDGEALRADLTVLRRRSILLGAAQRVQDAGARRREDARRIATWQLDAGSSPDPDLLLRAATMARFAHDFAQVERLTQVLEAEAPSPAAAVLRGEALYELGRFQESEEILSRRHPAGTEPALLVQQASTRAKNLQWGLSDWPGALAVVHDALAAMGPEWADELTAEEAAVRFFSGDPQTAIDLLEPIVAATPRVEVLRALTLGSALPLVGRTTDAIAVAQAALAAHLVLENPLGLAHPGTHLVNQAFGLLEAGRFAECDSVARAGQEVAVDDRIPIAQIWFSLILARSMALQGRYAEALRWAHEAASTARLHGFVGPLRIALTAQAIADAALGHPDQAAAAAAEIAVLPPYGFLVHEQVIGSAWAAWASGDPARARRILVDEAIRAEASTNRGSAGWLWHDAARLGATGVGPHLRQLATNSDSPLLAIRAQHVEALEADDAVALDTAAEALDAHGLVVLAAEASWSASDAHRRAGHQRAATASARRATALTARCPGVVTPGLHRPDGVVPLTRREREVALLAAQGLTSSEIGERLSVTFRTAENHLQNAYAKLGINRRDQLADALRQA